MVPSGPSCHHSLNEFSKTQTRQTFSTRKGRTEAGDAIRVSLWVMAKASAVAGGLGPSQVSLLPAFFSSSVSPKQTAPSAVHKTWLAMPHVACAEALAEGSGERPIAAAAAGGQTGGQRKARQAGIIRAVCHGSHVVWARDQGKRRQGRERRGLCS